MHVVVGIFMGGEMRGMLIRFCRSECGASSAEYAILASFIAVAAIVVLALLGVRLEELIARALAAFS